MGASTNISIGATTTDFQAALKAAQSVTSKFDHDIAKLFTTFRNGTSATSSFTSGLAAQKRVIAESARASAEAAKGVAGLNAQLNQAKNIATGAFSFNAVVSFGQAIAEVSGKFEKYQAVLRNGLGSSAGAKDSLNVLTDFAATTPFSLDELTGSFVKFVNRGITPTKQELTNLGDLAASQGKGFDQLTEAVLDAQSGEFERLKEFGIKAAKSGDNVTLSFKGVSKTIKNTSEEVTKAIFGFGQLGGVAGGMAAVSQTLEGKMSNLGDSFDRLLVALGESGVSGAFKEAIDMGQRFLSFVTELIANSPVDDLRNQQTELNGLVGALALASDNEGVRLNLIQRLKQEYPEFLGNLNNESVTTDLLSTRLAAVNDQYERKIRIALGQEKIKKATEEVTQAIDQQSNALGQLATASGKSIVDLEKLGNAGRIALAKKLAASQPKQDLGMGVYGGGSLSAVASTLEQAGKKQATAQAELNKLLSENATRQADLSRETVSGYKQQISLIQEKIKLHKIERSEGQAEIKRLNDQILIAQGKRPTVQAVGAPATTTKTRSATGAGLGTDNLSVFKRYAEQIKKEIEAIGPTDIKETDSDVVKKRKAQLDVLLKEKQAEFTAINNSIDNLLSLTEDKKIAIPGLQAITSTATDSKVAAIVDNIIKLARATPGLFANTNIGAFLTSAQLARPSLEFIQAKIEEIKRAISELSNAGESEGSPKIKALIAQLTQLKKAQAGAVGVSAAADAASSFGAEGSRLDNLPKIGGFQIGGFKLDVFNDSANTLIARVKELGQSISGALQGAAAGAALAMGNLIGGLIAGTSSLSDIPKMIGSVFADLAKTMGSALIAFGTAGLAAKSFVSNPVTAIVAGIALTALGAALSATISKQASGAGVKQFAKGGVFLGPQFGQFGEYPGAARNPEIATPQSIMRETFRGELNTKGFNQLREAVPKSRTVNFQIDLKGFHVRGSDIHLSQQRYERTIADYGL